MTDEEALKKIEEHRRNRWEEAWPGFLDAAEIALREKVAAQKAAKPKRPSLKEIGEALLQERVAYGEHRDEHKAITAAADILSALEKDVVPELRMKSNGFTSTISAWSRRMLEALGENVP